MSIIERLEDERVATVALSDDKTELEITEECDQYFTVNLSKHDVGELIKEFQEIHRSMG